MLSIIIDANAPPLALGATLGPLVRGVVEGMVGSATLIIPHESEEMRALADASGCRALVSPGFGAGFARATIYSRGAGVLVLKAGLQIGSDFWSVLADQLPLLGQSPAVTRSSGGGIFRRIARLQGRIAPDQALLLPPMLAREISLEKADPFERRYGGGLIILPTQARRIVTEPGSEGGFWSRVTGPAC